MKKLLLLAVSMLLTSSLFAQDIYLRGAINGWGATDEYKFTTTDNIVYTLEKEFTLTGIFKFADANWTAGTNFGAEKGSSIPTIGVSFPIVDGSNDNFDCGTNSFNVTKIVLDLANETAIIYGTSGKDEFDVTKDYGLLFGQYFSVATQNTRDAMTFKGNGVYELSSVVLAEQDYGCKIADESYSVEFGSNGDDVVIGVPYAAQKGGGNMWFDTESVEFGTAYKVVITIDKDYNASVEFSIATSAQEASADEAEVVAIYNMIGQPVSAETPGLKIFVYSDGTTEKKY